MTNLRNILAELYPDEASMRRLMADADIHAGRITLTSSAVNNWHAICDEAAKLGKLATLLAVAQSEYGENAKLREAVVAYQQSTLSTLTEVDSIEPVLTAAALPRTADQPIDIFLVQLPTRCSV